MNAGVITGIQEIVGSGQLWIAALLALAAGLISFASPCVLPLVPGYLAYVGSVSGDSENPSKSRVTIGAFLFVAGFSLVFLVTMAFAGTIAGWFLQWQDLILRILGLLVIAMGFVFMGFFSRMQQTKRVRVRPKLGLIGAPLLGITFAISWGPCMGPTLTMIFALSYSEGTLGRALFLAALYSLGLGIPFILIALGFDWMTRVTGFLKKHIRAINIAGGALMIMIGLLMVTGVWNYLMSELQGVIQGVVTPI